MYGKKYGRVAKSFKRRVRRHSKMMKSPKRFYRTSKRVHKMNRVPRGGFRI